MAVLVLPPALSGLYALLSDEQLINCVRSGYRVGRADGVALPEMNMNESDQRLQTPTFSLTEQGPHQDSVSKLLEQPSEKKQLYI